MTDPKFLITCNCMKSNQQQHININKTTRMFGFFFFYFLVYLSEFNSISFWTFLICVMHCRKENE